MWWPEHLRHLAWACNEARDKAREARRALALSEGADWRAAIGRPLEERLSRSAETLLLQQVLRAYEDQVTVLSRRLVKEYRTMTTMLNLDGKDPEQSEDPTP